jgi:hypothetical protein
VKCAGTSAYSQVQREHLDFGKWSLIRSDEALAVIFHIMSVSLEMESHLNIPPTKLIQLTAVQECHCPDMLTNSEIATGSVRLACERPLENH